MSWLESLYEQFRMYNGNVSDDDVLDYREFSNFELIVYLKNGDRVIHNHMRGTSRYIRTRNYREVPLTEEEWRREFSWRLREKIFAQCLTQTELSSQSGVSQLAISNYLNLKNTPSSYSVEKLARALECTAAELTDFSYLYD